MLKIFLNFGQRDAAQALDLLDHPDVDLLDHLDVDLLDHPDIERMDARALGDLPFPRGEDCPDEDQAKASVTLTSPTNRPFQLCMA